jgi:type I restriction enzyme S subunit
MTLTCVGSLVLSDESGFPYSKSKLVETGLPHLRPFNIGDDRSLDLRSVYVVPASEAPEKKRELLPGDILFNNTNSVELVGKAAIVRERMAATYSNHLTRIRLDTKFVEPEFFAFWLHRLRCSGLFSAQATQWVSQAAFRSTELRRL